MVACAPGVIACNMAHTPLTDASHDAAVFSLALMGTDYGGFLVEAARVLRPKGHLWIAEVKAGSGVGGTGTQGTTWGEEGEHPGGTGVSGPGFWRA